MAKKVLAMLRVSSQGQADDEKDGLPRQQRRIEKYCEQYGLEIIETYPLVVSGAYVADDSGFQDLIKRMADPTINGIVFASMDRFFRPKYIDSYSIFETFRKRRKMMYCDLGALDQRDPQDQMRIALYGTIAGQERRNIADRLIDGKNAARKNPTKKTDSLPCFISGPENGKFIYNDKAPAVRKAFELAATGENFTAILRATGVCTSIPGMKNLLENEWVLGFKHCLKKRKIDEEEDRTLQARMDRSPDEQIRVRTNLADTPLVDMETWNKVQAVLGIGKHKWISHKTRTGNFLGAGVVHCPCGQPTFHKHSSDGKGNNAAYGYYICQSRIRYHQKRDGLTPCDNPSLSQKEADAAIVQAVVKYLTDDKMLLRAANEMLDGVDVTAIKAELAELTGRINETERKFANTVKMLPDVPELMVEYKSLKVTSESLKGQRTALEAKLDQQQKPKELEKRIAQVRKDCLGFPDKPMAAQKALIAKYVEKVYFDEEGAILQVKIGFPLPKYGQRELVFWLSHGKIEIGVDPKRFTVVRHKLSQGM
jgi:DNA invertase Pin-like site-specific DNA recombinase